MRDNLLTGVIFFLNGIQLVLSKGFRRFIIVPVLVNLFLLITFILLLATYFSHHFSAFIETYPSWLTVLFGWLFWLIFWTGSFLLSTFFFTILTNIIASPFYGQLAEKVEKHLSNFSTPSAISILRALPHTLFREALKLIYFIPWLLLCLILLIFPPTFPIAPFVCWVVLAWILAIQYIDYVTDNQQVSLKNMIKKLKKKPYTVLGFGATVTFFMSIPGVNLIVPPAAVVGGTLLWLSLTQNAKIG